MKYLRRLIAPVLTTLLLMSSACTTHSLTPDTANKKLVGLWKMDRTTINERYIEERIERQKEMERLRAEYPDGNFGGGTTDASMEAYLSNEQWYEFKSDGTLKQTAKVMGREYTNEIRWELTGVTAENKMSALIHEGSEPIPIEIEFLSDDQIKFRVLPPDDAEADEIAEYEKTKVIFNREK
jgi:hypothetical protein